MRNIFQRLRHGLTGLMHRLGREEGQTFVVVALSASVLVGMTGLGVTVAKIDYTRSQLQNAVDAAALAGAQVANQGGALSPTASTSSSVSSQNSVIPQNDPGATGTVAVDSSNYQYVDADGTKVISGGFASVLGFKTFTVRAHAVAERWPGAFNYAVFQGKNAELDLNGNVSIQTVGSGPTASVFSDGTTVVQGSVSISGVAGAVGSVSYNKPTCSTTTPSSCIAPNQPYIAMPNLQVQAGNVCTETTYDPASCPSGTQTIIVNTTSTVKLESSVPYTLIVMGGGSLDITGNGTTAGNLAVFGGGSLTVGGGVTVNGIVYDPQGTIQLGGASGGGGGTAVVNGEVVGNYDSLAGNFTVNYSPDTVMNTPFNLVSLIK